MDEERRCLQIREMLRALLLGTARRMERVREQEQACRCVRFFGAEHAALTSAVGMTGEVDSATIR